MSDDQKSPNGGEFLLYHAEDGKPIVHLRAKDGSVWLTQAQLATLYQVTKQAISGHIKTILESKELTSEATVKEYLTVETETRREVERSIKHYALPMILAVGRFLSTNQKN